MTTTITTKGQVTLPKAVRDAVGLKPGDRVDVRATASGGVYIEKPGAARDYRKRLEALAKRRIIRGATTDEIMKSMIANLDLVLQRIPKKALFVAGRAFERYRRAGGSRPNVLADFFIGAHAQVEGLPILTRDTRRYRTYFPDVELIAPEA